MNIPACVYKVCLLLKFCIYSGSSSASSPRPQVPAVPAGAEGLWTGGTACPSSRAQAGQNQALVLTVCTRLVTCLVPEHLLFISSCIRASAHPAQDFRRGNNNPDLSSNSSQSQKLGEEKHQCYSLLQETGKKNNLYTEKLNGDWLSNAVICSFA